MDMGTLGGPQPSLGAAAGDSVARPLVMGLVRPAMASARRTGECGAEERGRRQARKPLEEDILLLYLVQPERWGRESAVGSTSARCCEARPKDILLRAACAAPRGAARALRKRML
ncbi:hypothetical protein NDU88_005166 [Pleurodeles waltl]|uniref:Uncharacterized protein n=1 Tax=Pleurodeles waltl TaxID=8319 RepID=A0AAV7M964_PLEWA|nr:hypothetical protein NDU88_005166 [Pleurodeles waltl]